MTYPAVGVLFIWCSMSVAFVVRRAPAGERSLPNNFLTLLVLMPNARSGCKKPSASLDLSSEVRQEHAWEAS
jgi:hypothetical protein